MKDEFFSGIEQLELKYDGGVGKMPIFYRKARSFSLLLPASLPALKKMLPDPRFCPAQAFPGIGVIMLSAFEYLDTDIGPYNEFSVGIVLDNPSYPRIPIYNLMRQYFARFYNVFIHFLPVTTEIALRAGVDYYNFPKIIADIEFSETSSELRCALSVDGSRIISLSCPKLPVGKLGETIAIANLYQDRQPQQAEFKLNVLSGKIVWLPREASWYLNAEHPVGKRIESAVIGKRAISCMYMPEIQGILYGPERTPVHVTKKALDAVAGGGA